MYSMSNISRVKAQSFTPYRDKVFVTDLEHGETVTKSGLILTDDNMLNRGIRARWGKVWAVGSDHVDDLEVGTWIMIEHGRWTQKITLEIGDETVNVWSVEYPKSVLLTSDVDPRGDMAAASDSRNTFATRSRG